MGKVCDWFMQTTETRSLAIAKRANFRKRLRGKGFPSTRRRGRRAQHSPAKVRPAKALVQSPGQVADPRMASGRRTGRRGRGRGSARLEAGGCDPQLGGSINWLSRQLVERRYNVCQKEPPPVAPPQYTYGSQKTAAAAAPSLATWSLLESPPVLSVKGTHYKLVPVGNALPASAKMQDATAPGERQHQGDGAASQRPGPSLLGCLRKCWVLLRNIEEPKSSKQSHSWSSGKVAKVAQGRRRRRRKMPGYKAIDHTQLGIAPGAPKQHRPCRGEPPGHLPALQSGLDVRRTTPVQQDCAMKSQGPSSLLTPQDNLITDVQWQLVGLKECRVILRKIKVLDGNNRNSCVGRQPPTVSSLCKHPPQSVEGLEESASGAEVEVHTGSHGAISCVENSNRRLATNNRGMGAPAFAKIQCFSSNSELNPRESIKKEVKDTFTDAKWKRRGLKECKVVLEKITPLVGNRFISLADGQLFRLGWNAI